MALDEWNVTGRVSSRHQTFTHKYRTLSFPRRLLASNQYIPFLVAYESPSWHIHLFHYFFSIYDAIGRVAVAVFPSGDSLIYLPVTHAISAAGTLEDHCI